LGIIDIYAEGEEGSNCPSAYIVPINGVMRIEREISEYMSK